MTREPDIAEVHAGSLKRVRAADRVSEAADRLFYARGIRAVGVEEIVAQAGVTKPSLYRRFASKDDLVIACLEARFAQVMADIDVIETRHSGDPQAIIRGIVAGVAADLALDGSRGCVVTNTAVEFPEPDHPTNQLARALKRDMRTRLLGIVRQLPTDRADALTDSLILLMEGARAVRHTSCTAGPARALPAAADALLAGFLNVPSHAATNR